MKQIESVAVLGAGAMGAIYASNFHEAPGFTLHLVARGDRCQQLRKHGLVINGKAYKFSVLDPDVVTSPVDLIIVALKHHHLAEAVKDLKNLIGEDTLILSVMNGLDSEAIIGAAYGRERVLCCIAAGMDAVRRGNQITFEHPGKLFFGEVRNDPLDPKVLSVQQAFERAGLAYETPQDMARMMWWKFMVNVGMNQSTAVLRAPYSVMQTSPEAQALMEALMDEVVNLAQAAGIDLSEKDITDWYDFLNRLSPQGKTSMLQDIEAGRKTEVEIFAGKVVELGIVYNIPTPVNEVLLHIIKVMEQFPPG